MRRLVRKNISFQDIDCVFISHCHDDHVGSVAKIIEKNPMVRPILSRKASAFSLTGKPNNIKGSGYINKRFAFILKLKGK